MWSYRRYVGLLLPAALIVLPATCVITLITIAAEYVVEWAAWYMNTMTRFADWCKAPVYENKRERLKTAALPDDYGTRK